MCVCVCVRMYTRQEEVLLKLLSAADDAVHAENARHSSAPRAAAAGVQRTFGFVDARHQRVISD